MFEYNVWYESDEVGVAEVDLGKGGGWGALYIMHDWRKIVTASFPMPVTLSNPPRNHDLEASGFF
jgi:hypothetical protein